MNFLASDRQNSSSIGVFVGGESIASNIFDVWKDIGRKKLECNVFVTANFKNSKDKSSHVSVTCAAFVT